MEFFWSHDPGVKDIYIAIDTVDDIFSDFDPRPVSQRALSEDFIAEIKKRFRESPSGKYQVIFLAPNSVKPTLEKGQDKLVISRVRQFFRANANQIKKDVQILQRRGVAFILFGMSIHTLLLVLTQILKLKMVWVEFLGVFISPLAWFGIWEGFSKFVDLPLGIQRNRKVFEKLSKASYIFQFIDDQKNKIILPR